jgi:hypothetical protein
MEFRLRPNQELFDQLFRDQIRQARQMSPEERVREGLRLSDLALRVMADNVRNKFPGVRDDEVQRLLKERVNRIRQLGELR